MMKEREETQIKQTNSKTLFTSDQHLLHENILRLCNRPFPTIQEHDRTIISNHNSLVSDNDTVYCLGDLAYKCSDYDIVDKIRNLNGKLIIILGNHDKALRLALCKGLLKKELNSGKVEIVGGRDAIMDHTLSVSKMIVIDGQKIFISHYSYRSWPGAFRGTIHLFGHSHSRLSPFYRSFDVGVDCNNFFPYTSDEIFKKISMIPDTFSEDGNVTKGATSIEISSDI